MVVNIKDNSNYDVYIGRGKCPKTGKISIWGNPFTHIKTKDTLAEYIVDNRKDAIEKYREYILNKPELLDKLDELNGKVLGCWCKPDSCHGDILLELVTAKKIMNYLKNG